MFHLFVFTWDPWNGKLVDKKTPPISSPVVLSEAGFIFCRSGNLTPAISLTSTGSYLEGLGMCGGVVFLLCFFFCFEPNNPHIPKHWRCASRCFTWGYICNFLAWGLILGSHLQRIISWKSEEDNFYYVAIGVLHAVLPIPILWSFFSPHWSWGRFLLGIIRT